MSECYYIIIIIILIFYIIQLQNKTKCNPIGKKEIENILRSSSRYGSAALQDENPFIANLHGNYGAAYMFSLTEIKSNKEIKEATGIDMKKFRNHILQAQDYGSKKLLQSCPMKVQDEYLAHIAGETI